VSGLKKRLQRFRRRWRSAKELESRRNNTRLRIAARAAGIVLAIAFVFLLGPEVAMAQKIGGIDITGGDSVANRPLLLMAALATLSLVPFVGMMVTSFVKIAVVLSITRQALGTQQAPPTTVITGLAIILTVYVMQPVGLQIYNRTDRLLQVRNADFMDKQNVDLLLDAVKLSKEPVKNFLKANSDEKNRQMFFRVAYRLRDPADRLELTPDDFVILMPSFVITELTKAFQIGFIIFVPFLVIDMVVSNILMALGMQMLSPTTISLPFKILLFVLVDGWYLITRGLVLGYN
jgi:type III secretion protein R